MVMDIDGLTHVSVLDCKAAGNFYFCFVNICRDQISGHVMCLTFKTQVLNPDPGKPPVLHILVSSLL